MKKIFLLAMITAAFSSCKFEFEKEVDSDFKIGDPKLVVNSIFSSNDNVTAWVYKSQGPFGPEPDTPLSNATLMLFEDGVFKETMGFTGNYYQSSFKPQIGKYYKVVGKYPGLPEVSSSSFVPVQMPFASYTFTEDAGLDKNGYPQSSFTFTINDPGYDNYYKLEFYTHGIGGGYYKADFRSEDPVLQNDDGFLEEEATTRETFSDQLFNGSTKTFTIFITKTEEPGTDDRYIFRFHHLTKEAYNYLSKVDVESYSYPELFIEPVFIYSNIENGYGIFAGTSMVEQKVH